MLEIHEWINIWESDDKESNPINEVKNKINHYINSMEFYCDYHIGLDFYNANLCLTIHICSEIDMGEVETIMNLTKYICKIASGSYGTLFVKDEDFEKIENSFQVYRIARGKQKEWIYN